MIKHLYHGTSEARWNDILAAGAILPRSGHDGTHNWDDSPSHPNAVYLTTCYAPYFGVCALSDADLKVPGSRVALIEIDAHALLGGLTADEDALEQSTRAGKITRKQMERRTRAARNKLPSLIGTEAWERSCEYMGTCAHIGAIPLAAISRVALVDIQTHAPWGFEAINPSISRLNFVYCGARYAEHLAAGFELGEVIIPQKETA